MLGEDIVLMYNDDYTICYRVHPKGITNGIVDNVIRIIPHNKIEYNTMISEHGGKASIIYSKPSTRKYAVFYKVKYTEDCSSINLEYIPLYYINLSTLDSDILKSERDYRISGILNFDYLI